MHAVDTHVLSMHQELNEQSHYEPDNSIGTGSE